MKQKFKLVRVTHFAIPSPKYFAIPSPKYFASVSPNPFSLRSRSKEVRVTHYAIPSPNYFASSPLNWHLRTIFIESINWLGVCCNFFISSNKFDVFIETLSAIDS